MSKTGKAPAFQFYAADWLADENVALMTLEEEGAYIHLLAYCWREGSIPKDVSQCSRLAKNATPEVITSVQRAFNECLTDKTRLVHGRLEREREKQEANREQRSEAGKASGEARRKKAYPNANGAHPDGDSVQRAFNERSTKSEQTSNSSISSSSSSSDSNEPENPPDTGLSPTVHDGGLVIEAWNSIANRLCGPGGYAPYSTITLSPIDHQKLKDIWHAEFLEDLKSALKATPDRGTGKQTAITLGAFLAFSDTRDLVMSFKPRKRPARPSHPPQLTKDQTESRRIAEAHERAKGSPEAKAAVAKLLAKEKERQDAANANATGGV